MEAIGFVGEVAVIRLDVEDEFAVLFAEAERRAIVCPVARRSTIRAISGESSYGDDPDRLPCLSPNVDACATPTRRHRTVPSGSLTNQSGRPRLHRLGLGGPFGEVRS